MNDFPKTADDFYALRDDRTNRLGVSPTYQTTSCEVLLAPTVASETWAQITLLVVSNLLSRWCRKVRLIVPAVGADSSLGMGNGDLSELLLKHMSDADPFGDFQAAKSSEASSNVAICVGPECRTLSLVPVFINASGWLASISTQQPIKMEPSETGNHVGAIAAACIGVAQAFKMAIGLPPKSLIRDGILDLFSFSWREHESQAPWPADRNVGKVLMVGAGSVASSAAYCMRMAGLGGTLSIVDKDTVKIENFNRSPIFGRATWRLGKSEAVAAFLQGSAMTAQSIPLWWGEFLEQSRRASLDFDVWLPLANEFGVRSSIQHNVPPLMVHASTGSNWGVNHGRHIPGRDDCLLDRFPDEVSAEDLTCATGQVKTATATIDAALPFASLFAGLLIVADLVRAQLPGYPQVPNFALFDFYGPLEIIQAWDRAPRHGCVCREQGRALHDRFNKDTRYSPHFRVG